MATALAEAHIEGQARLRRLITRSVEQIWRDLPGYDRANLDEWLSRVLPVIETGQRASAALTNAYIASFLDRQPAEVAVEGLIGADARMGAVTPQEAYERPFIVVWTALKDGKPFEDAVAEGLGRATRLAATDIQLTMRQTLRAIAEA